MKIASSQNSGEKTLSMTPPSRAASPNGLGLIHVPEGGDVHQDKSREEYGRKSAKTSSDVCHGP